MALIKLRKANETREQGGAVIVNTDQIVAIIARSQHDGTSDGRRSYPLVKETPDEVAELAWKA